MREQEIERVSFALKESGFQEGEGGQAKRTFLGEVGANMSK